MKLDNAETLTPLKPEIHDRGRGPEIKGTRITVYDVLDFVLACWHPARIAAHFRISSAQVEKAVEYIREHKIEVLADYIQILERCARGNPPEIEAMAAAHHQKVQELVARINEAKARGDTNIDQIFAEFRESQKKDNAYAGHHGGQ